MLAPLRIALCACFRHKDASAYSGRSRESKTSTRDNVGDCVGVGMGDGTEVGVGVAVGESTGAGTSSFTHCVIVSTMAEMDAKAISA